MPQEPSTAGRKPRAGGERTRARILAEAERLFAERGVDAVSLREIRLAAGQRNSSVVQFHFGDARGLLLAMTTRHMPRIGELAAQAHRDVVERGDGDDPAALTEVMTGCYADYIELGSSERAWVRIASSESTRPERLVSDFEAYAPPTFIEVGGQLLTHLCTFLPPEVALERLTGVGLAAIHLCADRARALDAVGEEPRRPLLESSVFKANLLAMTRAAMLAPLGVAPTG